MNLFKTAKATKETKAKPEKTRVVLSGEEGENFFNLVEKLEVLNDRLRSDTTKADLLSIDVREIAKNKWSELYSKTQRNPDSIMIEARNGSDIAQVMLIPQDKYISITEERATELSEQFGEDVVESNDTYIVDTAMVEKYSDVLSDLIMNCDLITDADKELIIKRQTKFSVAKGTVDKLDTYASKTGGSIEQVMESIRPIVMLKKPEVIKG